MSTLYTPFRYDFVGSFLRPESLKEARAAYEDGRISSLFRTSMRRDAEIFSLMIAPGEC